MSVVDAVSVSRAERRKRQTHQAILDAVTLLLFEVGYPSMTVRTITERADIGYGTFYEHFQDKDAAVWEVIEGYITAFMDNIHRRVAHYQHPEREYNAWLLSFENIATMKTQCVDLFGKHGSHALTQRYNAYMIALHTRELQSGTFRSNLELPEAFTVQYIVGAFMGVVMWWLENDTGYTADQMARHFFECAYRTVPPTLSE